jgi:hypothetical protein
MDFVDAYGGGGWGSAANKRFFYLVVNGNIGNETVGLKQQQAFFRSGTNSGPDYVYIFIDIGTDNRLGIDLSKRSGGAALYKEIEEQCPLFLITDRPIHQLKDITNIKRHRIDVYDDDVSVLYKEMGISELTARKRFVRFLRRANRYANLKPNMLGLGVNVNEILADMIDKLEQSQP